MSKYQIAKDIASLESQIAALGEVSSSRRRCECRRKIDKLALASRTGEVTEYDDCDQRRLPLEYLRVSVDHSTNDNGFLECCYDSYHTVVNTHVYLHSSTRNAFANIRGGPPEDWQMITGHGNQGLIITGDGQVASDPHKYMNIGNEAYWWPHASQGINGQSLTLFGCRTGGGTAGANFLRRVAAALGKQVGAWTGDVWCSPGRWPWGTGTFVTATKSRAPEVVESPEMYDASEEMQTLRIQSADGLQDVPISNVTSVNYTPVGIYAKQFKAITADKADAHSLLRLINFCKPFITPDKPGAVLTGLLTVNYHAQGGDEYCRSFRVLAYSLLQDVCFPDTYYYVSSALARELESAKQG